MIAGQMLLTIGGETRRYGPGDWYFIPAGVEHGSEFLSRFQALDLFADANRYAAKARKA